MRAEMSYAICHTLGVRVRPEVLAVSAARSGRHVRQINKETPADAGVCFAWIIPFLQGADHTGHHQQRRRPGRINAAQHIVNGFATSAQASATGRILGRISPLIQLRQVIGSPTL